MTTDNRLTKPAASDGHVPWTATQYYQRAMETGQHEKARLWRLEAIKRGELAEPRALPGQ